MKKRNRAAKLRRLALLLVLAAIGRAASSQGGSATWSENPKSENWSRPRNWVPASVPDDVTDVATFGPSAVTTVRLGRIDDLDSALDNVDSVVFTADASAYTIQLAPTYVHYYSEILVFNGAGIVNNSGWNQNFLAGAGYGESARIYFDNEANAGADVTLTTEGGEGSTDDAEYGAFISFDGNSSAGRATIVNQGGRASGTIYGGFTNFGDFAGAEAATVVNNAGTVSGAGAAHTLVQTEGDVGSSTFINNPASVPGAEGGWTEIDDGDTEGATFVANGATVPDCEGGQIYIYGQGYGTGQVDATFTAEGGAGDGAEGGLADIFTLGTNAEQHAVVVANGGVYGGLGGTILIEHKAPVALGQFQVYGNGVLDLKNLTVSGTTIGSLEGDGLVNLAGHDLSLGNNNQDATFGGVISGSGDVRKVGSGTLALNGANNYTGNTTVSAGTLSGSGTIPGKLSVASRATVAPAGSMATGTTLHVTGKVTFDDGSSYRCLVSGDTRTSDQIVAGGVTIQSDAQFVLTGRTGKLRGGTSFTIINNLDGGPISGTFANLSDGAIVSLNGVNFQASYEGGDGNDLTLMVTSGSPEER